MPEDKDAETSPTTPSEPADPAAGASPPPVPEPVEAAADAPEPIEDPAAPVDEPVPAVEPTPEPAPPPPPATSGGTFRLVGVALVTGLVTGLLTLGASALYFSLGERSRAEATQAEHTAALADARAQTARVQAELEALHQRQALYVAHTSVVRSMQELDKSNFGSAEELLVHAGKALDAADPVVAGEIKATIEQTSIEVGADRLAQLAELRRLAKELQTAMEAR